MSQSTKIVIAFAAMLLMTLMNYFVASFDTDPESFENGVQAGFNEMSVVKSVIGTILFLLITIAKPSRWTFIGTACLLALTIHQCVAFSNAFDDWTTAIKSLYPILLYAVVFSPTSWLEYVLTYNVLKFKQESP